jgi:ankyrin repeat protein
MCGLLLGFGRKEVVEYLLENGAKVNAQDDGEP